MCNMAHDNYVQLGGTCTSLAKVTNISQTQYKKFAVSNTNGFISVFPTRTQDLNM